MYFLASVDSEWKAGTSSRDAAAEPEAAGLSQQGGASQAPEIHGHCSKTTGGQATQRGERLCASNVSLCMCVLGLC